jgi:hypothetical protein
MNSYNGFTPNQRMKAYKWLMEQYASNKRTKPTKCDSCGLTEGIIEPHSENYSEPYGNHIGQYGFCYRCHMMLHCRYRSPKNFEMYCELVSGGAQFQPFFTKNWTLFSQQQLKSFNPPIHVLVNDTTNILYQIHAHLPTQQ